MNLFSITFTLFHYRLPLCSLWWNIAKVNTFAIFHHITFYFRLSNYSYINPTSFLIIFPVFRISHFHNAQSLSPNIHNNSRLCSLQIEYTNKSLMLGLSPWLNFSNTNVTHKSSSFTVHVIVSLQQVPFASHISTSITGKPCFSSWILCASALSFSLMFPGFWYPPSLYIAIPPSLLSSNSSQLFVTFSISTLLFIASGSIPFSHIFYLIANPSAVSNPPPLPPTLCSCFCSEGSLLIWLTQREGSIISTLTSQLHFRLK